MSKDYGAIEKKVFSLLLNLPKEICYHNLRHTKKVISAALFLGRGEDISDDGMTLLKTAALFHDTGFLLKYGDNEEEGVKMARRFLPSYGYSTSEIRTIEGLILATRVSFVDGLPVQKPGRQLLKRIICDADLSNLGSSDFIEGGNLLREEMQNMGIGIPPKAWNKVQLDLLNKHKFFTKTAQKEWTGQVKKNIEIIKKLIDT